MNSTTRKKSLLAGGFNRPGATSLFGMALAGLLLAGSQLATAQVMIVDRGLPTINLNNIAGTSRANVSWAEPDLQYFDGDDFTVPASGVVVDTIRLWLVGYQANNNHDLTDDTFLGNFYNNVSLYVGPVGSPLNRVSLASFIAGTDTTSNPNVVGTRVQYNGGVGTELDYQSGGYWTIVQLDFKNLNLYFAGGTQVQFGMYTDNDYAFSHASNAALSGSPQDQADGLFRQFQLDEDPATATFVTTLDSYPTLWDKSSDINVQVFASTTKKDCQKFVEQEKKAFDDQQKADKQAFADQQKADKKAFDATHPTPAAKKAFDDGQQAAKKAFDDQQQAAKKAFEDAQKAEKQQCEMLP